MKDRKWQARSTRAREGGSLHSIRTAIEWYRPGRGIRSAWSIVEWRWRKPIRSVIVQLPTVLRVAGFRMVIFLPPREHAPPHVHVRHVDGEVVIELGSRRQRGIIRSVFGMRDHDVRRAVAIVESHLEYLHDCWSQLHGPSYHDR